MSDQTVTLFRHTVMSDHFMSDHFMSDHLKHLIIDIVHSKPQNPVLAQHMVFTVGLRFHGILDNFVICEMKLNQI